MMTTLTVLVIGAAIGAFIASTIWLLVTDSMDGANSTRIEALDATARAERSHSMSVEEDLLTAQTRFEELNHLREIEAADFERAYGELVAQLLAAQARIEALEKERAELRGMGAADLQTLGDRPDYALAAYALKDMETTKRADLVDLCWALSRDGAASRGDWDGLRKFWWAAALAAKEPPKV